MDPRMMNAWLQSQAQKPELTTTKMQQKRLGIKEYVDYGDVTTRVTPGGRFPRSPESSANLARRLENLAAVAGDTTGSRGFDERQRAAASLAAKGVGVNDGKPVHTNALDVVHDVRAAAEEGKDIHAGKVPESHRITADKIQKEMSKEAKLARAAELKTKMNTIKTGKSKLPGKLGAVGAVLGLAAGAQASDVVHSLNPLSALDSGSLGTDDMMGEPIEFKEPAPKQQKPLPGAQFMYPTKMNENNMMKQWLKAQTQKQLWF